MPQYSPYPLSDTNKRYQTFDYYTRQRFGGKCAKATLDIGYGCPNKDGTCGHGGCIYCREGSRSAVGDTLEAQYAHAEMVASRKWKHLAGMIPYFQSGTNTYGPLDVLQEHWHKAASLPGAVMIGIGTRADCLGEDVLDALERLAQQIPVMVELGLQTVWDKTAAKINRGYEYATFLDGYSRLQKRAQRIGKAEPKGWGRLMIGIHLINGLPGETEEDMLESVRRVGALAPDMVKLHLLHVLRNTVLGDMYVVGAYQPMERDEYCRIVCRQLELLPPDTIIGRITGDGMAQDLLAPAWSRRKTEVANTIDKMLAAGETMQGKLWSPVG